MSIFPIPVQHTNALNRNLSKRDIRISQEIERQLVWTVETILTEIYQVPKTFFLLSLSKLRMTIVVVVGGTHIEHQQQLIQLCQIISNLSVLIAIKTYSEHIISM